MKTCCQCSKRILINEQDYKGVEYIEVIEVNTNASPIVFNQFPPGDAGLGYACSLKCFQEYVDNV